MREIKFRAWSPRDNVMSPSGSLRELLKTADHTGYDEFDEQLIYMQYTGLKDKSFDEVDIYEGDLFGKSDGDGTEVFGEVYFDADFAGFCVKYPNGGWTTLGEHLVGVANHRIVIGNIYENPELLEAK